MNRAGKATASQIRRRYWKTMRKRTVAPTSPTTLMTVGVGRDYLQGQKLNRLKERMQSLLQNGEKITPKQWKVEIQSLQADYGIIGKEQTKTATELAYAEVISYDKKNLERELQNES